MCVNLILIIRLLNFFHVRIKQLKQLNKCVLNMFRRYERGIIIARNIIPTLTKTSEYCWHILPLSIFQQLIVFNALKLVVVKEYTIVTITLIIKIYPSQSHMESEQFTWVVTVIHPSLRYGPINIIRKRIYEQGANGFITHIMSSSIYFDFELFINTHYSTLT